MIQAVAATTLVMAMPLRAQAPRWPTRPVTIVVMFPAGGVADTIARTSAAELTKALGQPFVVENRAGANGQIAAEFVARSAPDGHTLFLASDAAISLNPLIYTKLRYDPARDFVPVTQLARGIKALLVSSSLPVTDVAQLVAYAKANPGKLNYASFGIGSNPHLDAEMFGVITQAAMTHVPYKGVADAVPALVAGDVHVLFSALGQAMPHIQSGRLRALAVFTGKRLADMPNLPTAHEQGLDGIAGGAWFGLMAPARVPREIVESLAAAAARSVGTDVFRSRVVEGLGMEPLGNTPAAFAQALVQERSTYAAMVKAARLEPQASDASNRP